MKFISFADCLSFFYSRNQFAIKLGLDNMNNLLEQREVDLSRIRFIHVAGTNGKGSTCYFMQQILRARGYKKVGLYTSPHLVSFRERISLDDVAISEEWILKWLNSAHDQIIETNATYFECVTLMAFEYFVFQKCDICVLETGLGGRLDATNVVDPLLTLITSISLDHQSILGETLPEIAREKLGILKQEVPLVIDESNPMIIPDIEKAAKTLLAPVFNLAEIFPEKKGLAPGIFRDTEIESDENSFIYRDSLGEIKFQGDFDNKPHLLQNLALSFCGVRILEKQIKAKVRPWEPLKLSNLPGRLQVLQQKGLAPVILDCAHNEDSLGELANYLQKIYPKRRVTLLFSIMRDKNLTKIKRIVSDMASEILFESLSDYDRSLKYSEWQAEMNSLEASGLTLKSMRSYDLKQESILTYIEKLNPDLDLLVVAGSFYLLGKVIPQLANHYSELAYFNQF